MKKAIIITPFYNYSYDVRIKYVVSYFEEVGYESIIITSDFDHRTKNKYYLSKDNVIQIPTKEYKKNLSIGRILSHFLFARDAYEKIQSIDSEIVYCSGPPNFLFYFMSLYKKKFPKTKLVFEIGDMWPETLPIKTKIKKFLSPILGIWSGIRNISLRQPNAIIFECELFKKQLNYFTNRENPVIYLSKEDFFKNNDLMIYNRSFEESMGFVYIGSLNHIVDIDLIVKFLVEVSKIKKVIFHIIGMGERERDLIELCKKNNIKFYNHGIIYDNDKKFQILQNCHFAFNIMKEEVVVGATMKSLEYFHWGLPIINNIKYDSEEIVDSEKCGYNITSRNISQVVSEITKITPKQYLELSFNSRKVFLEKFDERIIKEQFLKLFKDLELY